MIGDFRHSMVFSTKHLISITSLPKELILYNSGVLCNLPAHVTDASALHSYQYIAGIIIFHRS